LVILSIDPALRHTGYAVLAGGDEPLRAIEFGVLDNPRALLQSECLLRTHEAVAGIIARHHPCLCAVESVIYVQSYRTAITLGAARAAALLAAIAAGLPVYEYPPKRVKQAVVGRGAADKQQVAFMVRALLKLTTTPPPDAADAIAVGLAHFQAHDPRRPLPPDVARL
jgi:crossover junction endodeoxyribonuclease RuvC